MTHCHMPYLISEPVRTPKMFDHETSPDPATRPDSITTRAWASRPLSWLLLLLLSLLLYSSLSLPAAGGFA